MIWSALAISLKVALVATGVVAVVGTLCGRHLARRRYRGRALVDAVLMLPMFLPPTVLGYYLAMVIRPKSPIGGLIESAGIELLFTWLGAALASVVVALPLMVRSARIAFESVGRQYEEAAAMDGAGRFATFFHIVLPLARNGLFGGVALAFARAIGEFGATLMVSGNIPGRTQTMPLAIYEAFTLGDDNTALLLSLVLTGVALVVVFISLSLGGDTRRIHF